MIEWFMRKVRISKAELRAMIDEAVEVEPAARSTPFVEAPNALDSMERRIEQAPSIAPSAPTSIIEPPRIAAFQDEHAAGYYAQHGQALKGERLDLAIASLTRGPLRRRLGVFWIGEDGKSERVVRDETQVAQGDDERHVIEPEWSRHVAGEDWKDIEP